MTKHSLVPDAGRPDSTARSHRFALPAGLIVIGGVLAGLLTTPTVSTAVMPAPTGSTLRVSASPPTSHPQPPTATSSAPERPMPMPTPQAPAALGDGQLPDAGPLPIGRRVPLADDLAGTADDNGGPLADDLAGTAGHRMAAGAAAAVPAAATAASGAAPGAGASRSTNRVRTRSASASAAQRLRYDRSLIYASLAGLVLAAAGLLLVGSRRRLW